jgi:hypothetical protein
MLDNAVMHSIMGASRSKKRLRVERSEKPSIRETAIDGTMMMEPRGASEAVVRQCLHLIYAPM